jgi:hypothetical protein
MDDIVKKLRSIDRDLLDELITILQ